MDVLRNIQDVFYTSDPEVIARHPEWLIDGIVGATLNPSHAILVTGFWRSGTSVLLELLCKSLGAKAVFEPFRFGNAVHDDILLRRGIERSYITEPFMPFWRGDWPAYRRYLRQALTGATPGVFVRASRRSIRKKEGGAASAVGMVWGRVRDALRRRVVVKSVRAHFILARLAEAFSPRGIVHIRRDPRAVVASLVRKEWNWFEGVSLVDLLLRPEDGRQQAFSAVANQIKRVDEEDGIAKCAAYWAITERHLLESEVPGQVTLSYEDMCRKGVSYVNERLGALVHLDPEAGHLSEGSASTKDSRENISVEERIYGWKNVLGDREVQRVEDTVAAFGMGEHLPNGRE